MILIIVCYNIMCYIILYYMSVLSKAPQGNERGAAGSKNPPAYWNPCFSLLGTILRTLVSF